MIGPVQLIAVGFDSLEGFHGKIIEQLDELETVAAVRILDILFVAKEENGDVVALEAGDLGEEEGDDVLGMIIGELMGFSFEGDPADSAPADIAHASALGAGPDDIRRIAQDLAPGTAAALLLVEHRWAAGLRDAIVDAGGSMLLQAFLTIDGLMMVGAELAAAAEAVAAIEDAEALEAIAAVRSVEALAAIELAAEVEAAVVARTVRQLVEAGFIAEPDAGDAVAAIVDSALVEQATMSTE